MFEKHFKLTENPFSLTPDPRFIYPGRSHEEALATLRYWVEHREGFVMVTGEVGTGKTTALFRLIDSLEQRFEIAFITNSTLNTVELLEEVCRRFKIEGITPGLSKSALLQRLEAYLIKLRDLRHAAILIIDEAQNFNSELLEEVRLLSNTVVPSGPPLLQIALVGQPELERKLSLEELRQLRQRIGVHYRIKPLSENETIRYVRHRIGVAGGNPDVVFGAEAARQLFRYTCGLPREINQVASQAMLHAFVDGAPGVSPEHVKSAAWEMQFRSVLDRGDGAAAPAAPVRGEAPASPAPGSAPLVPAPLEPVVDLPAARPSAEGVSAVAEPPASPPGTSEDRPLVAASDPTRIVAGSGASAAVASAAPVPSPVVPPSVAEPQRPALKTVPPLELPASRDRAASGTAPPITRVSRFGPLPETGAPEPSEKGASIWPRLGLVLLAVGLLAGSAWLLLAPKPKTPPETTVTTPEGGVSPDVTSRPPGALSAAAVESLSAERADSSILYGGSSLPGSGSAAADSAARHLALMRQAPAGGAAVAVDTTSASREPNVTTARSPEPVSVRPEPPTPTPPTVESPTGGTSAPPPRDSGAAIPPDAWRLQVASFRDSALAYREARRLAQRMSWSYEVQRNRQRNQETIYAVFVGPFASRADADSANRQIQTLRLGFKEALPRPPRGRR